MTTGYNVSGRGDLDTIFLGRSSAARPNVGYQSAGTDLSILFEPIGAGTPVAPTGYRSGGTDLSQLFRSISQPLPPLGTLYTMVAGTYLGSAVGYQLGNIGSLSPTHYNGQPIRFITDDPDFDNFLFAIEATVPQNFFTSVSINGRVLYSADAYLFTQPTGGALTSSNWYWAPKVGIVHGGSYSVIVAP